MFTLGRPEESRRSRSRSRSPRRRDSHPQRRKNPRPRRDSKPTKEKNVGNKGDKKENKSEYLSVPSISPANFEEAWLGSFFSPSILLLITALGLVVNRIPVLNNIPIGGRLRHCIDAWKKVTANN